MQIIVNGACGRLGTELCGLLREGRAGCRLAGAADLRGGSNGVFTGLSALLDTPADVLIDFSHHSATEALCAFAAARSMPLVIATTGQTRAEKQRIRQLAEKLPIFVAANLSFGVAVLNELVEQAAKMLPDADVEIVEQHHAHKRDAPSGTAIALAHTVMKVRPKSYPVCGRHGQGLRSPQEIGVHALRMGSLVGTHTVCFANEAEIVTLTHEAGTTRIYAAGALRAAAFISKQPAGLYGMPQLLAEQLGKNGLSARQEETP